MQTPKISILVPSRERLNLKFTLISSIIATVNDINNVELLFGIDDDDPTLREVYNIEKAIPFIKIININNNGNFIGINKIWNLLYPHAKGNIFGYIGDDMIFKTPNWDVEIIKEFKDGYADNIKLVHCYDGHRIQDEICVNAFLHKKYTEILGYMCREEFLINWSDQWMYQTFKAFNRVKYKPDIYIHHNHWIYGGRTQDKVANRMLSDNKDKISDKLWYELTDQRVEDVKKLSKYLGIEPDWTKVDTYE